MLAHAAYTNI